MHMVLNITMAWRWWWCSVALLSWWWWWWLIDQCGLKGISVNGAQVNPLQALVLTNVDNCSANDVLALASLVKQTVWDKFQIELEHEVRFINSKGETNLCEIEGGQ